MASEKVGFTFVIEEVGLHKQTSVGSVLSRIQFVDVLILIPLFLVKDNIFVWYGHRYSFSLGCHQTALDQETMFSKIPA